jgi:poly-gamma-glutamate capsule biosynthesis protein CapA/YwtB (metallophosphatase superfamily)
MKTRLLSRASTIAMASACVLGLITMRPHAASAYDPAIELQTSIADGFTYAVVGDIVTPLPSSKSPDPAYQAAMKIIRDADAAFANFEMSAVDYDDFEGPYSGGFGAVPEIAKDLKAMGFDLMARATNHQYDFGSVGSLETNQHLEDAGIVYAGSGPNYGAAYAPRYLMTNKGRVGMVVCSTSQPFVTIQNQIVRAKLPQGELPGRPGVAQIEVTPTFVVPRSMEAALQAIKRTIPTGGARYAPTDDTPERFSVLGKSFKYGDVERPLFTYEANKADVAVILRSIREAKIKSNFVTFGIHSHEIQYPDKPDTDASPGDFLRGVAHQVIDAGADAFVGSGVHVLRGIEIYKGRPIYYGLGEFFRQMDINRPTSQGPQRGDVNSDPKKYESIIAVNRYVGGQLSEVRLHPVQLGAPLRMALRGLPRVAGPEIAQKILKRLQDESAQYGTQISIENNIGIIRVAAAKPTKNQ